MSDSEIGPLYDGTEGENAIDELDEPTPACGFCQGKPVGNAATWLDGKSRPPLPCPRCGETNYPKDSK